MSSRNPYNQLIAVTNRHFSDAAPAPEKAFLHRVREVLRLQPRALVLREKDLSPQQYRALAEKVLQDAEGTRVPVILHGFPEVAAALGVKSVHLPLPALEALSQENPLLLRRFSQIGTSVHSVSDAERAVSLGASYLFAGNVFETSCKPGLPARGLAFLEAVCAAVPVPVYGIGGVTPENLSLLLAAGAAGGCMMSGYFRDLTGRFSLP